MKHIVLLGDSIFDNKSYVNPGEPDVPNQLRSIVEKDCKVTHLAVDGHVTRHIQAQLNSLPSDASHLFISVGGNDGLGHLSIFTQPIETVGEGLQKMYKIGENFKKVYSSMLDNVLKYGLPTSVCNIYYPRFYSNSLDRVSSYLRMGVNVEKLQEMAMAAETIFNDIISYEAFKRNLPFIDLRVLCDDDQDFANPIEPSCIGGMKIAKTINKIVDSHNFNDDRESSKVYI